MRLDSQLRSVRRSYVVFGLEIEETVSRDPPQTREGGIRRDWHLENHTVPAAVFGNVCDSARDRLRGRTNPNRLPAQKKFTLIGRCQTEKSPCQLRASRSDESGKSKYLTGAHTETHAAYAAGSASKAASLKQGFAQGHGPLGKDRRQFAPDHQMNEFPFAYLVQLARCDGASVAENGHAITDGKELLEAV